MIGLIAGLQFSTASLHRLFLGRLDLPLVKKDFFKAKSHVKGAPYG